MTIDDDVRYDVRYMACPVCGASGETDQEGPLHCEQCNWQEEEENVLINDQRAQASSALVSAALDFHAAFWCYDRSDRQQHLTKTAMDALERAIFALGYKLEKINPEVKSCDEASLSPMSFDQPF